MQHWYSVAARYEKTLESGQTKKVTEQYIFDALSVTEAEKRAIDELLPFTNGDLEIKSVKQEQICEILFDDTADKWYQVKAAIITLDERTAKEKRTALGYLVAADTLGHAFDAFINHMRTTMADYEITAIAETTIIDVYQHKPSPC